MKKAGIFVFFAIAFSNPALAIWHAHLDFEDTTGNPAITGCSIDETDGRLTDYFNYGYTGTDAYKNWKRYSLDIGGGGSLTVNRFSTQVNGVNSDPWYSKVIRLNTGSTPPDLCDDPNNMSTCKDRAEYTVTPAIQSGHEYYFRFRLYIPMSAEYPAPTKWFKVMQVRQNGAYDESPPLSINYQRDGEGKPMLSVSFLGSDPAGGPHLSQRAFYTSLEGKMNQWNEITLRFKMGAGGYAQLFFNGQASQVMNWDLAYNTNDCPGCVDTYTLKFGIYRGGPSGPMFLNYDDVMLYDTVPY